MSDIVYLSLALMSKEEQQTIHELIKQGPEGKWTAIILLLHRLGGWTIFAACGAIVTYGIWIAREKTTESWIAELQRSREREEERGKSAYEIIWQNSKALEKSSEAQQQSAEAQKQSAEAQRELIQEIRRNLSH